MKDVELSDLAGRLIAPCGTAVNATHIGTDSFFRFTPSKMPILKAFKTGF